MARRKTRRRYYSAFTRQVRQNAEARPAEDRMLRLVIDRPYGDRLYEEVFNERNGMPDLNLHILDRYSIRILDFNGRVVAWWSMDDRRVVAQG